MSSFELVNADLEEKLKRRFLNLCATTAIYQGRLSYLLMSLHYIHPEVWASFCNYNPNPILYANMIYGVTVMFYWRHSMTYLGAFHRISFSILGSLMFNYSSIAVYDWLKGRLEGRHLILALSGFVGGRIMMMHLLGFLYHTDRVRGFRNRAEHEFDGMYSL